MVHRHLGISTFCHYLSSTYKITPFIWGVFQTLLFRRHCCFEPVWKTTSACSLHGYNLAIFRKPLVFTDCESDDRPKRLQRRTQKEYPEPPGLDDLSFLMSELSLEIFIFSATSSSLPVISRCYQPEIFSACDRSLRHLWSVRNSAFIQKYFLFRESYHLFKILHVEPCKFGTEKTRKAGKPTKKSRWGKIHTVSDRVSVENMKNPGAFSLRESISTMER